MSETKVLNTSTRISRLGSSIGIFTEYIASIVGYIEAFISNTVSVVNGVSFKENELGFTRSGFEDISFSIDSSGNLIIRCNDDRDFYINESGDLIFEYYE